MATTFLCPNYILHRKNLFVKYFPLQALFPAHLQIFFSLPATLTVTSPVDSTRFVPSDNSTTNPPFPSTSNAVASSGSDPAYTKIFFPSKIECSLYSFKKLRSCNSPITLNICIIISAASRLRVTWMRFSPGYSAPAISLNSSGNSSGAILKFIPIQGITQSTMPVSQSVTASVKMPQTFFP